MRIQLRRIMCTTDISDFSNNSLAYGISLAGAFDSCLYACHVISLPSLAGHYGLVHIDTAEQIKRMETYVQDKLEKAMGNQLIKWESLITTGHISDEINRLVMEKDIDLVIAATHGRSGLKRLLLGSVTERLMRILPCPLLIIRGPIPDVESMGRKRGPFQRILVGCDFSEDSKAALHHGLSLAQEFQSDLHVVHVIEPNVYIDIDHTSIDIGADDEADLQNRLGARLEGLIPSDAHNWCAPKTVVLRGQSYETLTQYAETNRMDLVVLGARGYSLAERMFVGSTTDRVARRAPCPVLSVNPKAISQSS